MSGNRFVPTPRTDQPQSMLALFAGIIDPKQTEYHGVQMRSRLEADFAAHLDLTEVAWKYEPRIYGPKGNGYLPDFEVIRPDGRACFVEVKATKAEVRRAACRMEVIWQDDPEAILIIACAEGSTYYAAIAGGRWTSWVERWRHA